MTDREHPPRFELPISVVDEELSVTLNQVSATIEEYIRARIGNDAYNSYIELRELDASLEDSMSDETKELWRRHRQDVLRERANQLASTLPESESDDASDEDKGLKVNAGLLYHAQLAEILMDGDNADEQEDAFIDAFGEITGDFIDEIELLLVDRYPELEVTSLDDGRITFCGYGRTIDHETASDKRLIISFHGNGGDITTTVAYSYIPLSLTEGEVRREEIDIALLNGNIEHISIDQLKRDTLRALQLVLVGRS
jgi:hypothetical protein